MSDQESSITAGGFKRLTQTLGISFNTAQYEHWTVMILALVTGILAGYGAIGFYLAIDALLEIGFGTDEAHLATVGHSLSWWHILLVPVIGGLVVGQLLRFLQNNRAEGVPHVIESAALKSGDMSLKQGLASSIVTIISLGSGASVGREGPVVHLGATLASSVTKRLNLNAAVARTLLGCGVASAVAASFNAPIAGVFFALEVIVGHYALHAFAPIVIAAIAGTLISRIHLGDFPAFTVVDYDIVAVWEFPAFIALGIIAAMVATLFMRALHLGDHLATRYLTPVPFWLHPAIGGLIIGGLAIIFPELLSVGYEATSKALHGEYTLMFLLPLIAAKILATSISLAARFGGGVFSPSLFIGAMVGSGVGHIVAHTFPAVAISPGLYAIVGMGAVASAVLGAPISTILIVFEITGDYSITIAVMVAAAISSIVASLSNKGSFFHQQLARRGLSLEGGKATYLLESAPVRDHLDRDFFTLSKDEPLRGAAKFLMAQGGGHVVVTDETGKMIGLLGLADLPHNLFADDADTNLTAGDAARKSSLRLQANDKLATALSLLEKSGEDVLPVVSDVQEDVVIGLIKHSDVIEEYNMALLETQGR